MALLVAVLVFVLMISPGAFFRILLGALLGLGLLALLLST